MIPNQNCIVGLLDLLTRPMARRACRLAICRLRSPSTPQTAWRLARPSSHTMTCAAPLPPTRTRATICRRLQAPTSVPPRIPAGACPHTATLIRMAGPYDPWGFRPSLILFGAVHMHDQHTSLPGIHTLLPRSIRVRRGPADRLPTHYTKFLSISSPSVSQTLRKYSRVELGINSKWASTAII